MKRRASNEKIRDNEKKDNPSLLVDNNNNNNNTMTLNLRTLLCEKIWDTLKDEASPVFSPFSIECILLMIYLGSDTTTCQLIENVLGLSPSTNANLCCIFLQSILLNHKSSHIHIV